MPTNLPPEYFAAEERYRAAGTPEEKIASLEELISTVPKHKGTDKLRADLRRKLSKLRDSAERGKKGVSKQVSAFHIDREGAGQVAVFGPPNTGKSALVDALTNASPEVAPYPFTTWTPTPGMMPVENVQIQLIDTPPINEEFVEPELIALLRRADLIWLVVDLQAFPLQQIEDALAFLKAHRIVPTAQRKRYVDPQGRMVIPLIIVVNKSDTPDDEADFEVLCELMEGEWTLVPVSATTGRHVDTLKWETFEALEIIRIYSKPPREEPDLSAPFVMKRGSTVEEFAGKVHKDFLEGLKAARLWGSAQYDGQMVGRDHVLQDGDVVELHT
jgi:hypothetical protein